MMMMFQRPVDRGDVLLSLSYLPTAERLILVVVKARNLTWPSTKSIGGSYDVRIVRCDSIMIHKLVYLMCDRNLVNSSNVNGEGAWGQIAPGDTIQSFILHMSVNILHVQKCEKT